MDLLTLLNEHGWPAASVGLILYAIQRFAKYATPRVDKLIDAHIGLIETLKTTMNDQGEKIHEIHEHVTKNSSGV